MKHESLFKIHIPEPCHEDWGKMTPNQQGAFCKVCSKTVVDFSNKNQSEIQSFISQNLDKKICGRFKTEQLEQPKLKIEKPTFVLPGFLFPLNNTFKRAFAAAMIVMTLTLASCGTSNGNSGGGDSTTVEVLAGAIAYYPDTTKPVNTIDSINNIKMLGEIDVQKPDTTKQINLNNFNDDVVGKIAYDPPKDTTVTVDTTSHIKMGIMIKTPVEQDYRKGDVQIEKNEK